MGAGHSLGKFPAEGSVVVVKGKGESGDVRRNPNYPELVPTYFPEVKTMYDAFQRGLKVSKDRPCFGYRPITKSTGADGKEVSVPGDYVWFTYAQVAEKVDAIGAGMVHLNLAPANDLGHKLVGLYSKNRFEWCIAEQACHAFGFSDVPLYDTLGSEAIAFILGQTAITTVFTDSVGAGKLIGVVASGDAQAKGLKNIVQFEDVTEVQRKAAADAGLTMRSFEEVMAAGRAHPAKHQPPKPDDLGFICYTSGTTGLPKGAMILHKNIVADASSAFTAGLGLNENDLYISYLPLAHSFERLVNCAFMMAGGAAGFFQGDTLKLMDDIKALRPTVFPSVPRLYNRIYDKITGGVEEAGGLKASLFNKALEAKKDALRSGNTTRHALWDKLVFAKVAGRVGLDRCRIMLTGSAPIAPHVIEFLRVVFGSRVLEGYGQTENSAACSLTSYDDQASLGHVGGPLACNDLKLVSVPEMSYLVSDTVHDRQEENGVVVNQGVPCQGRGEICIKGHNIFAGYYKDPAKTAEALDNDGWLHTGDIGLWDAQGNLRVIDRKKNIFKLSQGEYVAAEKIENVYTKSPLVAQCFVYGDSLHAVLVAIVVPDADACKRWANGKGKDVNAGVEVWIRDPELKKDILEDMKSMAKEAKLQGFEQVKDIFLEVAPWTPEDILTPSFKLKRGDAKKKYQRAIDDMYIAVGDHVAGKTGLKQGSTAAGGAVKSTPRS